MGRLSASTKGFAPFMIILALLAARITNSNLLSTLFRQSSTVILAIFFLPLSFIFFEDQILKPSTPFCNNDAPQLLDSIFYFIIDQDIRVPMSLFHISSGFG